MIFSSQLACVTLLTAEVASVTWVEPFLFVSCRRRFAGADEDLQSPAAAAPAQRRSQSLRPHHRWRPLGEHPSRASQRPGR